MFLIVSMIHLSKILYWMALLALQDIVITVMGTFLQSYNSAIIFLSAENDSLSKSNKIVTKCFQSSKLSLELSVKCYWKVCDRLSTSNGLVLLKNHIVIPHSVWQLQVLVTFRCPSGIQQHDSLCQPNSLLAWYELSFMPSLLNLSVM